MASSSGNVNPELVDQFLAVTGAERSVAISLLEACAGNLDLAVGMHMDSGGGSSGSLGGAGPSVPKPDIFSAPGAADGNEEDDVRAPIPQRTETLVEDGDDKGGWRLRRPKRFAHSVFDGFRDFKAETYHFEELARGKRTSKKRNLEDLFRPPVDITVKGTFQNAKDAGSSDNKWLLVNVQNVQEFPCQVLNRDVWSSPDARKLINDSFVFWQVYNDSEEGKRFMQFYKFKDWPYIAVLDPFTGESQVEWNSIPDGTVFCELARSFLSQCPVPDTNQLPSAAKKQKREPSIVDASEQEQMDAAIRASLEQHNTPRIPAYEVVIDSDSDPDVVGDSDVETFSDPDDVVVTSPPVSSIDSKNTTSSKPSASSQSSSSSQKKSLQNGNHSKKTSASPNKHLSTTSNITSNSLSSSTTTWSCSNPSAQSRRTNYLSPFTPSASSEFRISNRDLLEAGSSGGGGASLPGGGASQGLDSPLHDSLDLMDDLVSGRGAEVCTPDIPEVIDSSSNSQPPSPSVQGQDWKNHWGDTNDPTSRILLRFPDNVRDQVELPCSSSLQALVVFCTSKGFPPEKFELVTAFPRRKLSQMDTSISIQEAGLHPQETIFVQDI